MGRADDERDIDFGSAAVRPEPPLQVHDPALEVALPGVAVAAADPEPGPGSGETRQGCGQPRLPRARAGRDVPTRPLAERLASHLTHL